MWITSFRLDEKQMKFSWFRFSSFQLCWVEFVPVRSRFSWVLSGSVRFSSVDLDSVQFVSVQLSWVRFSSFQVQLSWVRFGSFSWVRLGTDEIRTNPTIPGPREWKITRFHRFDTLFEKKSVSDWSFSSDFKNFTHFDLGFVRSDSILSKSSVSYMNYYRYFDHFPWFPSKWTHFLWKKVCHFIIFYDSWVRQGPKTMDSDHLDTLFMKKSVSFWLFRSISQVF